MSSLEAVVFDWGGTLTSPIEVVFEMDTWGRVADHLLPDRRDEVVDRLAALERELWERSRDHQRSAHLGELIGTVMEEFGLGIARDSLEEAGRFHLDALRPHIEHDPQARSVLEELRARELKVGLLSNTMWPASFHEEILEEAGLLELIDVRLYTSEMDVTKPHPEAFRRALGRLDVTEPRRAVFVGDRPYDDIHGAGRTGMRTVHRPNRLVPDYDVEPDAVIDDLRSLVTVIDRWSG